MIHCAEESLTSTHIRVRALFVNSDFFLTRVILHARYMSASLLCHFDTNTTRKVNIIAVELSSFYTRNYDERLRWGGTYR